MEVWSFSLVVTKMERIRCENIGGTARARGPGGKAWEDMLRCSGPFQRREECLLWGHLKGKTRSREEEEDKNALLTVWLKILSSHIESAEETIDQ